MLRYRKKIQESPWWQQHDQFFASLSGRLWSPLPGQDETEHGAWRVTDCGGGGDCLFHSVAFALRLPMLEVRRRAAECVTEENLPALLSYYTTVAPIPFVRPDMTLEDFRNLIAKPGFGYLGDDTTLRLWLTQKTLQWGFVVFTSVGGLHYQLFLSKYVRRVVVLFHQPGHWQLVGYVVPGDPDHRVQTTFHPFRLPTFLTRQLARIGVSASKDFANWEPRLELDGVLRGPG